MYRLSLLLPLVAISFFGSAQKASFKWVKLFNGKDFTGWNKYLVQPLDSVGNQLSKTQLGFNNDPQNIFSIITDNGEKIIRVSGQTWGAISTREEYANYHLQLKFKWGKHTWAGKKNKPKDSGLLYHSQGEPKHSGWMTSQEFQIEEGNCGDYWVIGPVRISVPSVKEVNRYIYDPKAAINVIGDSGINWCHRPAAHEFASGEWNTLDLYCFNDTSVHVVNGQAVMMLYNSTQIVNNERVPLTSGKIQLQSEGAEVFFKDIKIRNISSLESYGNNK